MAKANLPFQVRIKSDGTPRGTEITTPKGEIIRCTAFSLEMNADKVVQAVLTIPVPVLDVEAPVTSFRSDDVALRRLLRSVVEHFTPEELAESVGAEWGSERNKGDLRR